MVEIEAQIKLKGSREQIERVREAARDIIVSWNDYVSGLNRIEHRAMAERRDALLALIKPGDVYSVVELLKKFQFSVNMNSSLKTLTRDLDALENANLIKKSYVSKYKNKSGKFTLISKVT